MRMTPNPGFRACQPGMILVMLKTMLLISQPNIRIFSNSKPTFTDTLARLFTTPLPTGDERILTNLWHFFLTLFGFCSRNRSHRCRPDEEIMGWINHGKRRYYYRMAKVA